MSNFRNIDKYCEECSKKLILNNNRDIERKRFCSRKCLGIKSGKILLENNPEHFKKMNLHACTPESNKKKGHSGKDHHCWIEDRSKVKAKRLYSEEKNFMRQVLKERNYTCEVTGQIGGKLSVHHLNGVNNKERIFDKTNVIVVKKEIHFKFHKLYGTRNINEKMWNLFIIKKEYL
jgi:hypothetical protein